MDEKDGDLMPFDLLVEILSRLPGKPLMRFKCVSKRWFNLITDPVFAELHNTRSCNREGGGVFVTPTWTDKCLMCVIDMKKEPLERVSVLEPSLPYDNKSTTNIVNGLICFYDNRYERRLLYLYNLTTRESISLPSPQFEGHSRPSPEQLSRTCLVGCNAINNPRPSVERFSRRCLLGFDPIDKEYKVLHFFVLGKNNKVKCQVLTIGGRKMVWRTLDISHVEGSEKIRVEGGFCADGYLYWTRENVMILFDVRHETFKSICLPVDQLPHHMRITLVKVQDRLLLVEVDWRFKRSSSIEITWWRLKEWRASGELQWNRNATVFEHRSLIGDSFNHFGQMFSARSPDSDSSIIDYYDLVTGKHQEFEVNNPRGILTKVGPFKATEVIDNIMPLRNALLVPE